MLAEQGRAIVRFFSLTACILCAFPSAAQDAAALRDLLAALTQDSGMAAASQPDFEMPKPIETAADIRFKTPQFTFVRIRYSHPNQTSNVDYWAVDYPGADAAFTEQVGHLTGLATDAKGRILELTDPTLGQYPFIYLAEGGYLQLSNEEVSALRSYLLAGGFMMVDDSWGEEEWAHLSAEFHKVFPEREIVELPLDHEVFRSYFYLAEKPHVPGLRDVMLNDASGEPFRESHYRGLIADDGRLMVIFCHDSDLGDGWEHASSVGYPLAFSFGRAIPMGINIVVYALSH